MSLQISIRVPAGELVLIRERVQQRISTARSQLVQTAINTALTEIIDSIPVQTGEAKSGWQAEQARVGSSSPISRSDHISEQSATNAVDHVIYLEYGTSRMQPRSIVRTALARLQSVVHSLFRLGN